MLCKEIRSPNSSPVLSPVLSIRIYAAACWYFRFPSLNVLKASALNLSISSVVRIVTVSHSGRFSLFCADNSDIDLENKTLTVRQGVKEIFKRDGIKSAGGTEIKIGKPKSATSKRTVPLNSAALESVRDLRDESYFGENTPLVCDEKGDYTKPVNLRKRFYRILKAAGIKRKGLHSLRHTFATNLVNGQKQKDGTIKALSPRQVADLLGHSTSQITELYYVRKDTSRLSGITEGFEM